MGRDGPPAVPISWPGERDRNRNPAGRPARCSGGAALRHRTPVLDAAHRDGSPHGPGDLHARVHGPSPQDRRRPEHRRSGDDRRIGFPASRSRTRSDPPRPRNHRGELPRRVRDPRPHRHPAGRGSARPTVPDRATRVRPSHVRAGRDRYPVAGAGRQPRLPRRVPGGLRRAGPHHRRTHRGARDHARDAALDAAVRRPRRHPRPRGGARNGVGGPDRSADLGGHAPGVRRGVHRHRVRPPPR